MAEKREFLGVPVGLWIICIALFLALTFQYWYPLLVPPEKAPVVYKYTTGLTVKFKIYDASNKSILTTNVLPEFHLAGADPFARIFTTTAKATGVYDATEGAWTAPLDAGTYVLLVKDTASTKTKYPEKITVTVTGTDEEDREVWLDPSQVNMYQRSTAPFTKYEVFGWNETTTAWDSNTTTVGKIDISNYDKWRVSYEVTLSDTDEIIKAGRYYWTKVTGLTITEGYLDGTLTTVYEDTESGDDGLTGWYISFNELKAGEVHRIDIYVDDVGGWSSGNFILKQYEYYACVRSGTALRWWTDNTQTITVQA